MEAELALVNKVELRIALAGSDDKFESLLNLYLAPLLLKLLSPHSQVRTQILRSVQHLITRIGAASSIKLPVAKLVAQVKLPAVSPGTDLANVQLYSLIFVSKGIDRLNNEEKLALLPQLVEEISKFGVNVQARLFYNFVKSVSSLKESLELQPDQQFVLDLNKLSTQDKEFLVQSITKFFLFQPVTNEDGSHRIPLNYNCPGLSNSDCQFLTTQAGITYNSTQLNSFKPALLNVLAHLSTPSVGVALLVANCDSSTAISDKAWTLYRRLNLDFEDLHLVDTLISMYIGDLSLGIPPVKPVLQEKILSQVLCRSKRATRSLKISTISSTALNSSYGKLKNSAIQFIQWVTQNLSTLADEMDTSEEDDFNITIAAQLKQNLVDERWDPNTRTVNYHNYVTQRRSQYQALGVILKKDPKLLKGVDYIVFLFEALISDLSELRSTIQDALGGLTVNLQFLENDDKIVLKKLFVGFLSDDDKLKDGGDALFAARYILIKYINTCFPFDDTEARLLCILGTSSLNRSNIIEEASKGLHPHWFKTLQNANSLEFKSTLELLGTDANNRVKFPSFQAMTATLMTAINSNVESSSLSSCMETAITFVIQCLVMQALDGHETVVVPDQEWAIRLEKALEFDEDVLRLLKSELARIAENGKDDILVQDFEANVELNSLDLVLSILMKEFIGNDLSRAKISVSNNGSKALFGKQLIKLLSVADDKTVSKLVVYLPDLYLLFESSKSSLSDDAVITYIAQSIGIIGSHNSNKDDELVAIVNKFAKNLESNSKNMLVLCLGYLVSRLTYRNRESVLNESFYSLFSSTILEMLKSSDSRLVLASLELVSQLLAFGSLGPEVHIFPEQLDLKLLLEPKVKKCNEKAVVAWANLSLAKNTDADGMDLDDFSDYEKAIYDTHISKQIDFLFTSGEAFTVVALGWNSKVLNRMLDINQPDCSIKIPESSSRLSFILDKILKACSNTKPSLRKLGCIWLLSFVQYLSHMPQILDRAAEIHVAFTKFLADRDELVQESASRGLSIVYEMGNLDLKDTLVRGLLRSFTDSSSAQTLAAGSVGEDTQLFEPGVLNTGDGSVSTYKDILNLASEVGDPSLVYKFMSLARHSALWSSRKGIAFGLGSILSKSSLDDLLSKDENLRCKLIPKLFRYRFDPSPTVRKSMDDIWGTLVADSSKTISENFDIIMDEILKGIGSREWRVRQASTTALADLLPSAPFERYESRLDEIWSMSLRSVDDIKESVRKEGTKLSRSLASILVRNINVEESGASLQKSNEVLKKLIPTLLGVQGLLSDVEDIRNFALETILNLCKKSGVLIKPFIPELIEQLISLMSTLEPQIVNYLTLNADKYNMKATDIDAKRLQGVGQSPMMSAIEKLLDLTDDDVMKELVPALQSSCRKSIGLPSKAAGSKVLVTLVVRHLYVVKPYGDQLLKTCQQQLKDRNETISSAYATAAGYLCRVASIGSVVKFSKYIQQLYFDSSESEQNRKVAGIACEAVSKYSGDKFTSVLSAFLPFAFIAKHDPEASVSQNFETVWSDNTAGNGAIKLYIKEISDMVRENLNSPQYLIKQVCAKSIADACNKIGDGANGIGLESEQLFEILIEACKFRSWTGKEHVFDALVSLAIKSKFYLLKDEQSELLEKITKVVLTEAKRKNKDYKKHAVRIMGKFVKEFDELNDEYVEIMTDYIADMNLDDEDDDDDEMSGGRLKKLKTEKSSRKNLKREQDNLDVLNDLVSTFTVTEEKGIHPDLLSLIFDTELEMLDSEQISTTWRTQVAICQHFNTICLLLISHEQKLDSANTVKLDSIYTKLFNILDYTIENVIIQFARATKKVKSAIEDEQLVSRINSDLRSILDKKSVSSVVKLELQLSLEI